MKKYLSYCLILVTIVIVGCQKELSFEGSNTPAEGSLQSDITGDCLPKTVNGVYEALKPLVADSNTITISVNVLTTGNYVITTDTVNGYFFRSTGIFTTPGINTVKLRGNGTPFALGTNNFVVSFDSTICDVQVTVLPAGAGGPAEFTVQGTGAPANCSGATVAGNYIIGTALNGTNTVTLSVNVTTIGTYSVSTTATNGMLFSKAGVFSTLGVQPLILTGSGTPTGAPGTVTIPIIAGGATCNFGVPTVAGGVYTINCAGAMVNGTYQAGIALTGTNTISLPITVTTAGPYSLSASINGMTFSNSGNLTLGTTSIVLNGSGTPTTSTGSPFNLSIGTPPCLIPITVVAGVTIDWEFTIGTVFHKGTCQEAILTSASGFAQLIIQGDEDNGVGTFGITLNNMTGSISTGIYSGTSLLSKFATFVYTDGTLAWIAGPPPIMGTNLPVNLTVLDMVNKKVEGTFTGTVLDEGMNIVPLTGGKFKANLP